MDFKGKNMSVSDKIRAALILKGKNNSDAAIVLGITTQAFNNKLNRNSFYMSDIIKLSNLLNFKLMMADSEGQQIVFNIKDIKEITKNENK